MTRKPSPITILTGDCRDVLATLPAGEFHCCVTSPPYFGLRDYGHDGQIGLEPTPNEFVAALVAVFREVRRVLRDDGTVWLNLGDSYCSVGGSVTTALVARNLNRDATLIELNPAYAAMAKERVHGPLFAGSAE